MADQDIASTETWLEAQGFHIDSVGHGRDRITFSGTALQVQAAFGAELLNRLGRDRTQRDVLIELGARDPSQLSNPVLIDFLCADLDEGMARWPMPGRERGMQLYERLGARVMSATPLTMTVAATIMRVVSASPAKAAPRPTATTGLTYA